MSSYLVLSANGEMPRNPRGELRVMTIIAARKKLLLPILCDLMTALRFAVTDYCVSDPRMRSVVLGGIEMQSIQNF